MPPPSPRTGDPPDRRARRGPLGRPLLVAVLIVSGLLISSARASANDEEDPVVVVPDWRARGLAHVDLPLLFRATFDTSYMVQSTWSDRLASPFVSDVGPGIVGDPALETRLSISRPLADRIEFGISWTTRNRLAVQEPMEFGRQMVGAFIRITP